MRRFSHLFSCLRPAPPKLPAQHDFEAHRGGLDEQCAWANFGGLTLEEACEKFARGPEVYREDFMFMGPKAFAFYYPATDRYLRETVALSEMERAYRMSGSLADCIRFQFVRVNRRYLHHLKQPVVDLCEFVLGHLEYFVDDEDDPEEIERAWKRLRDHVREYSR